MEGLSEFYGQILSNIRILKINFKSYKHLHVYSIVFFYRRLNHQMLSQSLFLFYTLKSQLLRYYYCVKIILQCDLVSHKRFLRLFFLSHSICCHFSQTCTIMQVQMNMWGYNKVIKVVYFSC